MSEVLYRKWRPTRFADIVGQPAITQTLSHAVASGRTSHAYLFCGPRGTGKTSSARVVAKAINCLGRQEGAADPDGTCAICKAVDAGNFVDLIEVDAASNRGIDEMRDLREKVRFAPTLGRYKVYIIDEAHAITGPAADAFLKTLEEPPPNTVFILATTEPHRLPATIVSRCQRFDFRRISTADVAERLREIASHEGVEAEAEALHTIARAAGGSLRDATNLLDQLITAYGVHLTLEQVRELLGLGGEERALALVKHLLGGNTPQALEAINHASAEGLDLRPLHRMTVDLLRAALLAKSGVRNAVDLSKEVQTEVGGLASRVSAEQMVRALRLFGGVSLRHDQPSPLPLELAVVELGMEPEPPPPAPPQVRPPALGGASVPAAAPPRARAPQAAPPQPAARPAQPAPRAVSAPSAPDNGSGAPPSTPEGRLAAQWPSILRSMSRAPRAKYDIGALLRSARDHSLEGDALVVRFPHRSNSERLQEELESPACRLEVERILSEALGAPFGLRVEAEEGSGENGPRQGGHLVRAAMSLGGQVASEPEPEPAPAPPIPTEETDNADA